MKDSPLSNEPERGLRRDVADGHCACEIELAVLALMLGVEVFRLMLAMEHPNDDAEEHSDDRHVVEYSVVRVSGGLTTIHHRRRSTIRERRLVHAVLAGAS